MIVPTPARIDWMVTAQEPEEPVIQLVRLPPWVDDGKYPRLAEKDMVIPCALFESCAVIVEAVVKSAGIEDGLADSVRSITVSVKVAECETGPLVP